MLIAQISDPHIIADAQSEAATRLQAAVGHLMRLPAAPAAVVVSGDCTDGGTAEEYRLFQDLIRPLPMPVYVLPGNHDRRERMLSVFGAQGRSALPGFVQYVVDAGPLLLVALDTHIPGSDEGELCDERLDWLEQRLAEAPGRPTLLFMHHPPVPCGMDVLDAMGLRHPERLGEVVARHPQVEAVAAGHIHCTLTRRFHGTVAVTCASTMHQLMPDVSDRTRLRVLMEPPSCLLHSWDARTGLVTRASAIGDHGPPRLLHDGDGWVTA
ncbi:MAG TPA: phosphodiesterase [Longimicrobium sp.]|jgi:3',5'-cyclic AMP phosphodiesterase CpdA